MQGFPSSMLTILIERQEERMWKFASVVIIALGGLAATHQANAVVCAHGVYRAGCVGPNGAVVVRKAPAYRTPAVACARGPYRAGCVGPNGNVVVRRRY
jgi:hypothetical protein